MSIVNASKHSTARFKCATILVCAVLVYPVVAAQAARVAFLDPGTAKEVLLDQLLPIHLSSPTGRASVVVRYLPSAHHEESISIRVNEADAELVHSILSLRARAELDARFDRTGNLEVDEVAKSCRVTTKRHQISLAEARKWMDSMAEALDVEQVRLKARAKNSTNPKVSRSVQVDGAEYEVVFEDLTGLTRIRALGPELDSAGGLKGRDGLIGWAITLRQATMRRR